MRNPHYLATIVLAAASFGVANANEAAGTYRLVPDDATRSFCRRHRLPLPVGKLLMRDDYSFAFTVIDDEGVRRTYGSYVIRNETVEFKVESGPDFDLPFEMRMDGGGLRAGGTRFEREFGANGRVRRGVYGTIGDIAASRPAIPSVIGTWTLQRDDREAAATRFSFAPDGTFRFSGANATSAGRYVQNGAALDLIWSTIDGVPVEPGTVVRKRLWLDPDGFNVDQYRYQRQR